MEMRNHPVVKGFVSQIGDINILPIYCLLIGILQNLINIWKHFWTTVNDANLQISRIF